MTGLNLRPAVRGLMINPSDQILLVRLEFTDWTGWVLPGGGREPGEDDAKALRRELREETGLTQLFMGPPLWTRRMIGPFGHGRFDGQEETVYLVPCHHFEIAPTMGLDELAEEGLVDHRWWSVAELEATEEIVRPEPLPRLVKEILEFGAPATPHLLD